MNRKAIASFLAGATVAAGAVALSGSTSQSHVFRSAPFQYADGANDDLNATPLTFGEPDGANDTLRASRDSFTVADAAAQAVAKAITQAVAQARPAAHAAQSAATNPASDLPSTWRTIQLLSANVPVNVTAALPKFDLYTGPQGAAYEVNVDMNGQSLKNVQVEANLCIVKVDGACTAISTATLPAHELSIPLPQISVAAGSIEINVALGYFSQSSLCPVSVDGNCTPGSLVHISQPMLMVDAGWQLIGGGRVSHTVQIPLV